MLSSELPAVRDSALDSFTFDNAQSRHGEIAQGVDDGLDAEIRACALRALASTPYARPEPGAVIRKGAGESDDLEAAEHRADVAGTSPVPADGFAAPDPHR